MWPKEVVKSIDAEKWRVAPIRFSMLRMLSRSLLISASELESSVFDAGTS